MPTYVPNNLLIFTAAYSGAIAGMAASYRTPTDPIPSDPVNTGVAKVAGAFAQSYDTLWGSASVDQLDVSATQELCSAAWWGRAPQANVPVNLIPATFNPLADALIAIVDAGEAYFTSVGISPPPIPGGVGSVSGTAPIVSSGGATPVISINPATDATAGSLSAADKTKLDGLSPGGVSSVSGTAPIVSSGGATPAISISAATDASAGSLSAADKTKLDGITAGAAVATVTGTAPIVSSGGTTPAISISAATDATAGSLSAADKTKLDGIASGATVATVTGTAPIAITGTSTAPNVTIAASSGTTTGSMSAAQAAQLANIAAVLANHNAVTNAAGIAAAAPVVFLDPTGITLTAAGNGNIEVTASASVNISGGSTSVAGEVIQFSIDFSVDGGVTFLLPNSEGFVESVLVTEGAGNAVASGTLSMRGSPGAGNTVQARIKASNVTTPAHTLVIGARNAFVITDETL